MSLEAIAGKNPRTHVGKIYNVLATRIANAIIMRISDIREAHCLLVSEIGRPVNEPSLIRLSIDAPGHRAATFRKELAQIIDENLCRMAELTEAFVASNVPVF